MSRLSDGSMLPSRAQLRETCDDANAAHTRASLFLARQVGDTRARGAMGHDRGRLIAEREELPGSCEGGKRAPVQPV
ncbi:hypothetical protein BE17_14980 [Sorangium cellulosum]|uniref:Uncharacterized protein n=1 Tax=Sorangium cellulosum TaxID=56 RepID=A0A150RKV3_SORCE|nr:hypothetical protein BE17_14980 [Sorangium cellulosum]